MARLGVKTSLSVKDNEGERLVNNNGQIKREFDKVEVATSSVHDGRECEFESCCNSSK